MALPVQPSLLDIALNGEIFDFLQGIQKFFILSVFADTLVNLGESLEKFFTKCFHQ